MATITNTYLKVEPIYRNTIVTYGSNAGIYKNQSEFLQNGQPGTQVRYEKSVNSRASVDQSYTWVSLVEKGVSANPRFTESVYAWANTGTIGTLTYKQNTLTLDASQSSKSADGFTITCKATAAKQSAALTMSNHVDPSNRSFTVTTEFDWPSDAQKMGGGDPDSTKSIKTDTITQKAGSTYDDPIITVTVTATKEGESGTKSSSFTIDAGLAEKSCSITVSSNYGWYASTYSYSVSSSTGSMYLNAGDVITGNLDPEGLKPIASGDKRIDLSVTHLVSGDYSGNGSSDFAIYPTSFTQDSHQPDDGEVTWQVSGGIGQLTGNQFTAGKYQFLSGVLDAGSISSNVSDNIGTFSVSPTMKSKPGPEGPFYLYPTYNVSDAMADGYGDFWQNWADDTNGNDYCEYHWSVEKTSETSGAEIGWTTTESANTCTINIQTNTGTVTGVSLESISDKSWPASDYKQSSSGGVSKYVATHGTVITSGSVTDRGGTGTFKVTCSCIGDDAATYTTSTTVEINRHDSVDSAVGSYTWSISNSEWTLSTGQNIATVICPYWKPESEPDPDIIVNGSTATLTCTYTCGSYSASVSATMTLAGQGLITSYYIGVVSGNNSATVQVESGSTYWPNVKWTIRCYYTTNVESWPHYFEPTFEILGPDDAPNGCTYYGSFAIHKTNEYTDTELNGDYRGCYEFSLIGSNSQKISDLAVGKYGATIKFRGGGDRYTTVTLIGEITSSTPTTYALGILSGGDWYVGSITKGATSWDDNIYLGTIYSYWTNDGGTTKHPVTPSMITKNEGFNITYTYYGLWTFMASALSSPNYHYNINTVANSSGNPSSLNGGKYAAKLVMNNGGDDVEKVVWGKINSSASSQKVKIKITATGTTIVEDSPLNYRWMITNDPIWTILGITEDEYSNIADVDNKYLGFLYGGSGTANGWYWLTTTAPTHPSSVNDGNINYDGIDRDLDDPSVASAIILNSVFMPEGWSISSIMSPITVFHYDSTTGTGQSATGGYPTGISITVT